MNKIMCVGEPFEAEHSSCSDLIPEKFRWGHTTNCDTIICIDNAIIGMFENEESVPNRFGWLCELPAIIPQVYDMVRENYEVLLDYYEAIFTCDVELANQHERIHQVHSCSNLPWIKERKIYNKTKNISLLASSKQSTEGQKLRHTIAEKFKDDMDIMGSITGTRFGDSLFDKLEAHKDYRFSFIIENSKQENVFTEKITDAFATGTIPVYWGCPDIGKHFNTDGIIELPDDLDDFDINSLTPKLYKSKMDAIKENFDLINKMKMVDDQIYNIIFNEYLMEE